MGFCLSENYFNKSSNFNISLFLKNCQYLQFDVQLDKIILLKIDKKIQKFFPTISRLMY